MSQTEETDEELRHRLAERLGPHTTVEDVREAIWRELPNAVVHIGHEKALELKEWRGDVTVSGVSREEFDLALPSIRDALPAWVFVTWAEASPSPSEVK